ncbi:hypothetical protein BDV93DRAFT_517772 [Ceratobasidium sp. AG-I]|nr:hypothetical protein BDV93DRAFT_517772 [Ceratobasidium sp. AG-I]
MSGNHFLRSMAEPASRDPESTENTNGESAPEVHFAETVSVVTGVNKLSEAPLVDVPLELTTPEDKEVAKANEQLRRSASRDRDMKDEEALVLKAVPRDPSEEPTTAAEHAAEVAEGVEKLEITPNKIADKKRKGESIEEEPVVAAAGRKGRPKGQKAGAEKSNGESHKKTRRGSAGGKKQDTAPQELRRSKRRKSE